MSGKGLDVIRSEAAYSTRSKLLLQIILSTKAFVIDSKRWRLPQLLLMLHERFIAIQ